MIKNTHRFIARLIYDCFSHKEQFHVSRYAFIKGSIYPDINLKMRLIHHSYESTFNIVKDYLNDLFTQKHTRYDLGHKLGVIAHFITDYTTAYHSNPNFTKKFFSHYFYERKIHGLTNAWHNQIEPMLFIKNLDNLEEAIKQYLIKYHTSMECDYEQDLTHAISLTHTLMHLILDTYMTVHSLSDIPLSTQPKIAIFTDTYFPHINGVSNTLHHMMKYYESHQIPYLLVSPKYSEACPNEKEIGFNIHKVKSVKFKYYPQAVMGMPKRRKSDCILDDFDPDIIHVMTEFNIGYYGLKYAQRNNIPVISNYSTHFHTGLKHMKLSFAQKPLMHYLRWFHNSADMTTTPSHDTKQYLLDFGINHVEIFGRGIDIEAFSSKKRQDHLRESWDAKDKFVLLYVGRVSGEKNLDIMLDAYQGLSDDLKSKTRLVVVGDGPILSWIRHTHKNVITPGFQNGEMLQEIYASADLFVFPSTSETLGNVVLEAMASGLPVIGVDQGGVKENIIDHYNGLLVKPNNVLAFQKAIEYLLTDQSAYQKLKMQALNYVNNKPWHAIFDGLLEHYKFLIRNKKVRLLDSLGYPENIYLKNRNI